MTRPRPGGRSALRRLRIAVPRPGGRRAAAGTGVLVASHDPAVVAAADRVVRLDDGAALDV